MKQQHWNLFRRSAFVISFLALWAGRGLAVSAQDVLPTSTTDEAPPVSPTFSPGPLSLEACLELGMAHQPALDAARASLAATEAGKRGLDRMIIPRLFRPDLAIRREQACQGLTIANAALSQAEVETRYAITRNFFTIQYIRAQRAVVDDVLRNLDSGYKRAEKLYKSGDPDVKITQIDLDALTVQTGIVKTRRSQVENGMLKALAALREAMGVKYDYPLDIETVPLPPAVYHLDKDELIASAVASRGEIIQAYAANRVTELEIQAQMKIFGWQGDTFAKGADIHVQPIPLPVNNGEYRPGAFGLEMPSMLAGRKHDRAARASALNDRAGAVVDKANNLVALDVEAQYLKWQEAVEGIRNLSGVQKTAKALPDQVYKLAPRDYTSSAVINANLTAVNVQTQLNDEIHYHALALAGLERATAGAFRIYPCPGTSLPMPIKY